MQDFQVSNFDVEEINNVDLLQIEGGSWWYIAAAIVGGAAYEIAHDWDNFKNGLLGRPEVPHK